MYNYDDEVLEVFLENQGQLFSENVAESLEEAEEFLEDCMAVVCKNFREVKEYFEEAGTDIAGMSDEDILEASEVFELPSGRLMEINAQRKRLVYIYAITRTSMEMRMVWIYGNMIWARRKMRIL